MGQSFHHVLGLNDIEEVGSAVIVRSDEKCADIKSEDLRKWLNVYWNFTSFDRVVGPYGSNVHREYYINIWTKDKMKSLIVYPNCGEALKNITFPKKLEYMGENIFFGTAYDVNPANRVDGMLCQGQYLIAGIRHARFWLGLCG